MLKQKILIEYIMNVRSKVQLKKNKFKEELMKRKDYQHLMYSDNKAERLKLYEQVHSYTLKPVKVAAHHDHDHDHDHSHDDDHHDNNEDACLGCTATFSHIAADVDHRMDNGLRVVSTLFDAIEDKDREIIRLKDKIRNMMADLRSLERQEQVDHNDGRDQEQQQQNQGTPQIMGE